jgi:uncharacterized membrane protein YeaQ/YmgE (transglycosylase-associated protein family)
VEFIAMSILSFLLFLVVAAVCAGIAEAIFPGRIPGGFLTTAVVGIVGGWVGASLFGSIGPALFGLWCFCPLESPNNFSLKMT